VGAQVSAELVNHFTPAGGGPRDWASIWIYPCVAAGVIMLIFAAIFRERANHNAGPDDAGVAEAAMREEMP
jgi:hypothetical protein